MRVVGGWVSPILPTLRSSAPCSLCSDYSSVHSKYQVTIDISFDSSCTQVFRSGNLGGSGPRGPQPRNARACGGLGARYLGARGVGPPQGGPEGTGYPKNISSFENATGPRTWLNPPELNIRPLFLPREMRALTHPSFWAGNKVRGFWRKGRRAAPIALHCMALHDRPRYCIIFTTWWRMHTPRRRVARAARLASRKWRCRRQPRPLHRWVAHSTPLHRTPATIQRGAQSPRAAQAAP